MTRFTASDLAAASDSWNCNCGPAALAAILDLTLDEVRPLFGEHWPGYTTPTMMFEALRRSGKQWRHRAIRDVATGNPPWPRWGLCRIQWHGPWTMPGANQRWAYRHTHWIASSLLQPTAVSIDPRVSFGRPVLAGTRVEVAIVVDLHAAGDTIDRIAEEFGISAQIVEGAIAWHRGVGETLIWDANVLDEIPNGWVPLAWWSTQVVPRLTADIPRATGKWSVTHAIEVER